MSWLSDFDHEIGNIGNGNIKPVYFLYGNDFYLRDLAIQTLRRALTEKGVRYDYGFYPGSEIDASELQNILFGTSLFQSAKCCVINQAKGLMPSARKILNNYLDRPEPGNVLILTADEIDGRNALYKRIQASAVTLMTTTPFESEIPAWVRLYCSKLERNIDVAAISELIRCVGADLGKLSNEIDKIDIYLPEKQEIGKEDVLLVSGYSKAYNIDNLLDAVGQKNKASAVAICKNLIENGVSEVYLITALYQFLWKLIMLKDQRLLMSPDLGKAVRAYRPKQLDQLKMNAARFTLPQLRRAVGALVDADRRLKTTSCEPISNFMIALDGITG